MVFLNWGERVAAEEAWRQLDELAARTRDLQLLLYPPEHEAWLAALDGRLEDALAAGARLTALAGELGSPVFGQVLVAPVTQRPLLYLGRGEEALEAVGQAGRMAGV